jgi:hypothetical protein
MKPWKEDDDDEDQDMKEGSEISNHHTFTTYTPSSFPLPHTPSSPPHYTPSLMLLHSTSPYPPLTSPTSLFPSHPQYSLRVSKIHLKVVRPHHRHAKCGVNKAPLGTSFPLRCLVCISAELAAALPTSSPTFPNIIDVLWVAHLNLHALEQRKAIQSYEGRFLLDGRQMVRDSTNPSSFSSNSNASSCPRTFVVVLFTSSPFNCFFLIRFVSRFRLAHGRHTHIPRPLSQTRSPPRPLSQTRSPPRPQKSKQ